MAIITDYDGCARAAMGCMDMNFFDDFRTAAKAFENQGINIKDFASKCEFKKQIGFLKAILPFMTSGNNNPIVWDDKNFMVVEKLEKQNKRKEAPEDSKPAAKPDSPSKEPNTPKKQKTNYKTGADSPYKSLSPSVAAMNQEMENVESDTSDTQEASADIELEANQNKVYKTVKQKHPNFLMSYIVNGSRFIRDELFPRGKFVTPKTDAPMVDAVQKYLKFTEQQKDKMYTECLDLCKEAISQKRAAVTKLLKAHLRRKYCFSVGSTRSFLHTNLLFIFHRDVCGYVER